MEEGWLEEDRYGLLLRVEGRTATLGKGQVGYDSPIVVLWRFVADQCVLRRETLGTVLYASVLVTSVLVIGPFPEIS